MPGRSRSRWNRNSPPRKRVTEQQFQDQVVDLARICGYQTMHVRRTIGKGRRWTTGTSVSGWPDLAIWGNSRFLLVELKTDDGKLSTEQDDVLESLRAAGVEVHVWRPRDWDALQANLTAHVRAS